MKNTKRILFALAVVFGLTAVTTTLTSCREKKTTGEKIEEAADNAGDAIEDAADDVGDAVEDATDGN